MSSSSAYPTLALSLIVSIVGLSLPASAQTSDGQPVASGLRKNTRVMVVATDYGVGAIGFHRLGRVGQGNFVIGGGILSARDLNDRTIDGAIYTQRGALMPLRFGLRADIAGQSLPSLEWTFYWVGTVGPVLAFGYPQGLNFGRTLSNISFGLGGEVYNALGLEAFFDSGFSLYLEGGVYAMNTFASRSLFRRASYLGPSLAFGIRTGF